MTTPLVLRRATLTDEAEVLRAHQATSPDVPTFLHYYQPGMPFARYLQVLDDQERGVNLPMHHVPTTFLFGFVGARVVGRVSLRHALTDFLLRVGGHIGYVVVPEYRRQGHATEMLRQARAEARARLGLTRVLVTCDDDNLGSIRVIERNGGVLESVEHDGLSVPKRRYWVPTAQSDEGAPA